jgi:hypothetical protein
VVERRAIKLEDLGIGAADDEECWRLDLRKRTVGQVGTASP